MKNKMPKLFTLIASSLCLFSGQLILDSASMTSVYALSHGQSRMSLGASLNAQQEAEVRQLLGGQQLSGANVIRLDGTMLHHYLRDGSNKNTGVYSSAIIVPQPAGYGVQVQIMTPRKITQVSATTYQNAAITSGAKDVLIRIATPIEVTGEGALAGVYALLAKAGVKVTPQVVHVAQKEITIINKIYNINNITNITNINNVNIINNVNNVQINNFIADIKKEVNNYYIQHNQVIQDNDINLIVTQLTEQYGLDFQNQELYNELLAFIKEYAESDIAKSADTVTQINQSIMSKSWDAQLAGIDQVISREDLLKQERQDYGDTSLYHPVISALYHSVIEGIEQDIDSSQMKDHYDKTFLIEKMLGVPNEQERQALNYIRTMLYHYVAAKDDSQLPDKVGQLSNVIYGTTKENWLEYLRRYRSLEQDTVLREMIDQAGLMTGHPMEATYYAPIEQVGDWLMLNYAGNTLSATEMGSIAYHPQDQVFGHFELGQSPESDQPVSQEGLVGAIDLYGVELANDRIPIAEIPTDYLLPDNSQAYTDGTELVAGEAVYQIMPMVAGQNMIDFIVGPNEVYKLKIGELETPEYQASETGAEYLELTDASVITEGVQVSLLVKVNEEWQEKATITVAPQPAQIAASESTEASETTEVESESTETSAESETTSDTSLATDQTSESDTSVESSESIEEVQEETSQESVIEETPEVVPVESGIWPQANQAALESFIAQWQVTMNQAYTRIYPQQAYDYQGVDLLSTLLTQATIDGQAVQFSWHHESDLTVDPTSAQILDVYTDNHHLYVFAYYQGNPIVLYAQGLNGSGGFDFGQTNNEELKQGFYQIVGQPLPSEVEDQVQEGEDNQAEPIEEEEAEVVEQVDVPTQDAPFAVPSELLVGQLLFETDGMNTPVNISVERANPNRIVLYLEDGTEITADVTIKNVATKAIQIFSADHSGVREVQVNTKIIITPHPDLDARIDPNWEFYLFLNKYNSLSLVTPNFAGNVTEDQKDVMLEYLEVRD